MLLAPSRQPVPSNKSRYEVPLQSPVTSRHSVGNRLSKIYTRTGDAGTTGLADGSRTPKTAPRIHALGDVDELNSVIGLLLCEDLPLETRTQLVLIGHDLFDLGGEMAIPGFNSITGAQVKRLEDYLDAYNATLEPLKNFILPGGSKAASFAHLARTVCRRAERSVILLGQSEAVSELSRQYLNRLSDLLFVLSRILNRHAGQPDVLWEQGRNGAVT